MLCYLADARLDDVDSRAVLADVDPGRIADLNGVSAELVRGVPGLRAYATPGFDSGLVVLPIDADANVSMGAGRSHSSAVMIRRNSADCSSVQPGGCSTVTHPSTCSPL